MDENRAETSHNQTDGPTPDETLCRSSHPADYDASEKIRDMPADSFAKCLASVSPESVKVIEHDLSKTLPLKFDIEHRSDITVSAEQPASQLKVDQKNGDFQDHQSAGFAVNDSAENSQSGQENWRPSNPFLGVANSNSTETGDSIAPKSVSGSSFVANDRLPLSTSLPSDMLAGYTKPRESGPSSLCSASPYESPTHAASAAEQTADMAGSRPDSLYLSRSILQERERQWLAKKGSYSSLSECDSSPTGSVEALIEAATSTPLHTQGTISMEGDMITFVADGINELIKRSRGDSLAASERTSRTPRSTSTGSVSSSTSGWSASALSPGYSHATRSPSEMAQSPEDIPPIDPRVVYDLELHARRVADNLDHMMHTLTNKLHKMSSCTYDCLDVYKDSVDSTCDAVDSGIKSMYALMAKCEELSLSMAPIYKLREQICEIKRVLDLFEAKAALDLA